MRRSGEGLRLKKEDSAPVSTAAGSRCSMLAEFAGRIARLVRRRREVAMRTLFEEAAVTLHSINDEFDANLRGLDAADWEQLSEQLDRVNDLLRSVVADVEGRRPPRGPAG